MRDKLKLDPFDRWMIKQNREYVKERGLEAVVNQLRANGYDKVAAAVEDAVAQPDPLSRVKR